MHFLLSLFLALFLPLSGFQTIDASLFDLHKASGCKHSSAHPPNSNLADREWVISRISPSIQLRIILNYCSFFFRCSVHKSLWNDSYNIEICQYFGGNFCCKSATCDVIHDKLFSHSCHTFKTREKKKEEREGKRKGGLFYSTSRYIQLLLI